MSPTEVLLLVIIAGILLLFLVLLKMEKDYNRMAKVINNQAEYLKMLAEHQVSFAQEVRLMQGQVPEPTPSRQVPEPTPSRPSLRLLDPKCLDPNYDPGTEINKL